jgi:hormone-sensitive lipase
MAIERGYRVPDGLMLAYPALSVSKSIFTPSLLLAMDDPILPHPFLKMCIESYVGNNPTNNPLCDPHTPLISPVFASDETLSKFPKTRIMIASNDPLRDESFRFTLRLAKLGVNVYLKEY